MGGAPCDLKSVWSVISRVMLYMEFAFYFFAVLCVYSYFLYPMILKVIPVRRGVSSDGKQDENLPVISLIITAHNEEGRIREKLDNTLQIDYPPELIEIIVASDCSTDETDSIVESYSSKHVRLIRADMRKGKEYAQWCAIRASKGSIMVFSDVATSIPVNAIRLLAAHFADSQIGAVSSEDMFVSNDGGVVGEGAYVKYEMWLRRLESDRAGLVGLSGSFFAARREVCENWDIFCPSDFNTALNCAKSGLIAITSREVVGVYKDVMDPSREYQRKVRTVIRGVTAIARHPEVLNPFRMRMFAFQVWSHKIMRWGVPWFMAIFFLLTLLLQGNGLIYTLALLLQIVFYGVAVAAWLSKSLRNYTLSKIIFFFVQTNLALAQAAIMFILGKRMTVWTPSKR